MEIQSFFLMLVVRCLAAQSNEERMHIIGHVLFIMARVIKPGVIHLEHNLLVLPAIGFLAYR